MLGFDFLEPDSLVKFLEALRSTAGGVALDCRRRYAQFQSMSLASQISQHQISQHQISQQAKILAMLDHHVLCLFGKYCYEHTNVDY